MQLIGKDKAEYQKLLEEAWLYKETLLDIRDNKAEKDPLEPGWNNDYLPGMDMIMLYTMVATFAPAQYVEIGSGHSTKVAAKAIREQQLPTRITCIDPQPRTEIRSLAQHIIQTPLEKTDLQLFYSLEKDDILFVDNSHRILPNSDAMVFFLEILPRLKKGVIVQLHDIYLPYDYPAFMCDRFYSEQYGLAIALLANPEKYKPILPNYFIHEDPELSQVLKPMFARLPGVEQHGGSFWFRIS
jgi:hypothetical protein